MIFNSTWRLKIGNIYILEEHGSYFYFSNLYFLRVLRILTEYY